jgi:hypothetical protein
MNETGRQNSPGSASRQGLTGRSPALARLFLVGLRPRRARLRFTGQNHYRTIADFRNRLKNKGETEVGGCIGPSSDEEEALACKASLTSPVDSVLQPSVALNETAM